MLLLLLALLGSGGIFILIGCLVPSLTAALSPPVQRRDTPNSVSSGEVQATNTVFSEDKPYPVDLTGIQIGTKLSTIKSEHLSGGKSDASSYQFEPASGPFMLVTCEFDKEDYDPQVSRITYHFRDDAAKTQVRNSALAAFGTQEVQKLQMGERLIWKNVNGCSVDIEPDWVTIKKSSK